MFIFNGRTLGTLAALACAAIAAIALGGCATPRGQSAAGLIDGVDREVAQSRSLSDTQVCMAYGPSLNDKRCGWEQFQKVEAALDSVMRY